MVEIRYSPMTGFIKIIISLTSLNLNTKHLVWFKVKGRSMEYGMNGYSVALGSVGEHTYSAFGHLEQAREFQNIISQPCSSEEEAICCERLLSEILLEGSMIATANPGDTSSTTDRQHETCVSKTS